MKTYTWISVNDQPMPLEQYIIVSHPHGVEAIHFHNHEWKFWYTGNTAHMDFLKSITHWMKPEKAT